MVVEMELKAMLDQPPGNPNLHPPPTYKLESLGFFPPIPPPSQGDKLLYLATFVIHVLLEEKIKGVKSIVEHAIGYQDTSREILHCSQVDTKHVDNQVSSKTPKHTTPSTIQTSN